MKAKLWIAAVLTAAICTACSRNGSNSDTDCCRFFPALGDTPLSNLFEVKVNGTPVVVEKMEKLDIPIHYVHFAYDGSKPIDLEITADQPIESYRISPLSKRIRGRVNDAKLTFRITEPRYLLVKINAMEDLFLIIDPMQDYAGQPDSVSIRSIADYGVDATGRRTETGTIQRAIDEVAATGGTLFFPAGIYRTGQLDFRSDMTILLGEGALIQGTTRPDDYPEKALIRMDGVSNFRLLGYGTIDGAGWSGLRRNGAREFHLVYASECENILFDGVVLRDPVFWNTRVYRCREFRMKNIKILNNRPYKNWTNTDGVDFDSSVDCSLVNAVMHCGDDNCVVKGLDSERKFATERILFDNILAVSNSAATKIGTETCVEKFEDITFRNIDIVKCKRAMVVDAFDSTRIVNVAFENICVEGLDRNGSEEPRIIDVKITDKSWRECTGYCTIDRVRFNGIDVRCNMSGAVLQILGNTDRYRVNDVAISGLVLEGRRPATLESAGIATNDFVENIVIE